MLRDHDALTSYIEPIVHANFRMQRFWRFSTARGKNKYRGRNINAYSSIDLKLT
jgi:hypothetical protein